MGQSTPTERWQTTGAAVKTRRGNGCDAAKSCPFSDVLRIRDGDRCSGAADGTAEPQLGSCLCLLTARDVVSLSLCRPAGAKRPGWRS